MDEVIGLSSRGAYTSEDYPVARCLAPRKPYFKTVREMEAGIESFLEECGERDLPPTVARFEDRYGRLSIYSARKGRSWRDIADRVRLRLDSAFVEYAFTHPAFQRLSAMKLARMDEFRPVRNEVEITEKHTFDFTRIRQIADMMDAEDIEEVPVGQLPQST